MRRVRRDGDAMVTTRELLATAADVLGIDAETVAWRFRFAKAAGEVERHQGKVAPATNRAAAVILFLALTRPEAHRVADVIATVGGVIDEASGSTFLEALEELIRLRRSPDPCVSDKAGIVRRVGVTEARGRMWPWMDHIQRKRVVFGDFSAYEARSGMERESWITDAQILELAAALGPHVAMAGSTGEKEGAVTEATAPEAARPRRRRMPSTPGTQKALAEATTSAVPVQPPDAEAELHKAKRLAESEQRRCSRTGGRSRRPAAA